MGGLTFKQTGRRKTMSNLKNQKACINQVFSGNAFFCAARGVAVLNKAGGIINTVGQGPVPLGLNLI